MARLQLARLDKPTQNPITSFTPKKVYTYLDYEGNLQQIKAYTFDDAVLELHSTNTRYKRLLLKTSTRR